MAASRRAALALPVAAALPAAAANPDAALIRDVESFIADELVLRARIDAVPDVLPDQPMPAAEAWLDAASSRFYAYHERMNAISMAEPTTAEGLAAQAKAMLWHFADEEPHAWNLAESVLRVLGKPMPDWAI